MFPKLTQPTVFIASPGDVASYRKAADREFQALRAAVSDDFGVAIYRAEVDTAPDGFDDSRPAQEQIYLPSDPLCRAVICIVAEKVGTPLRDDFPLGALANLPSGDGFRLVHPWEKGAEESGGFPLTGTVFEYLTALEGDGHPPILLLIVGDESVFGEPNPFRAKWGFGRLRQEGMARFGDAVDEFWKWEQSEYRPQRLQLSNFIRYLGSRRGIALGNHNLIHDETEARAKIRGFLKSRLNYRTRADHRSPFKKLEVFDTDDHHVFFGRREWCRTAIGSFERLWTESSRLPFFGIVGGSGTGKSSLLRAGLMAHLLNQSRLGDYCGVVVHPADLLSTGTATGSEDPLDAHAPLAKLITRLIHAAAPETDAHGVLAELVSIKPEQQIPAAVAELCRLLGSGTERRLVIGLDQFESLVDASLEHETRRPVEQLFRFVRAGIESGRIGALYTLQSNRYALLDQDPTLGPLCARGDTKPVEFPEEALEEIISRPFEMVEMKLSPALYRELRDRILVFADRRNTTRASVLPLISVLLGRLYEVNATSRETLERTPLLRSISGNSIVDRLADERDTVTELPLAGNERLLAIEDAIAHFAEQAYKEVERDAYFPLGEDTIEDLLQRLVRLLGAADERIQLAPARLPRDPVVAHLAQALLRRRLLIAESGGRVRLVHEAVLWHWPRARRWLNDQVRVLGFIAIAMVRARHWNENGRSEEALKGDADEAAEILSRRFGALTDLEPNDADDALLRAYCLALLARHPTPGRRVEASNSQPTHAFIGATYGALSLCASYVEHDPECIRVENGDGRTPIYGAALGGSLACLELWLSAGATLDVPDHARWTALHAAAWYGHRDVVEHCLNAGADPNGRGGGGATPLHVAARNGHEEIVALLLEWPGCDATIRDDTGNLALHQAAATGSAGVVRHLLRSPGNTPGESGHNGFTVLDIAARYGHAEVLRELAHHPAFDPNLPSAGGWTPLLLAASGGSADALFMLLGCTDIDRTVRINGETALHVAAKEGRFATVDLLLTSGDFDPNASDHSGETALHHAVRAGHYDIVVRLLTDARTAPQVPNREGTTPIGLAREHREILEVLLDDARIDPSLKETDDWTPLLAAAEAGLGASARRLLARGFDLSVPAQAAEVLYFAAGAGDTDLVRTLLITHEVDPWVPTRRGATPLHRAISKGFTEIVDLILQHEPNPDADAVNRGPFMPDLDGLPAGADFALVASAINKRDLTSLDVISAAALRHDTLFILRRLLADGRFNPNVEDRNGRTALHHATIRGNLEAVRTLLGHARTDATAHDAWGRSFVDYVPDRYRTEFETLVTQHGLGSQPPPAHERPDHGTDWHTPTAEALASVWTRLLPNGERKIDGKYTVDPSRSAIEVRQLPFYENTLLCRIRDSRWGDANLALYFVLHGERGLIRLTGTSRPIHELNAVVPIRLTAGNVLEYLRFFCFFVRGPKGPFYVLHLQPDANVPNEAWHQRSADANRPGLSLNDVFRPPALHGSSPDGHYRCCANVYYSNAIFLVDFEVQETGMIEMVSDEPLAASLSYTIEKPLE